MFSSGASTLPHNSWLVAAKLSWQRCLKVMTVGGDGDGVGGGGDGDGDGGDDSGGVGDGDGDGDGGTVVVMMNTL